MNASPVRSISSKQSSKTSRAGLGAILLAAFILAVFAGSALAAGKLVKNGSFEKDGDGDGIPNKWAGISLTAADKRVCNQSYAGACSFKMVADGTIKVLKQVIVVSGVTGEDFILSAWTKGKDVVLGGGAARIYLVFNHTDGSNNPWYFDIPAGTSAWALSQVSGQANENFDSITISLQFIEPTSGKVWADKVKLVAVP
jgi:hypothetical protein